MVTAYSRVAKEVKPSIILHAVDCGFGRNKKLCGTEVRFLDCRSLANWLSRVMHLSLL